MAADYWTVYSFVSDDGTTARTAVILFNIYVVVWFNSLL